MVRRILAVPLLVLALVAARCAAADQKDPDLVPLFKYLKSVTQADEADAVENRIWEIWSATGDPALDRLMADSKASIDGNDLPAALETLDRITQAKPDFAEGWNQRATVHYLMGEYAQALADIDRTLELEPRHFGALSGLGLVNLKLGRAEAAADAFERVIRIDPLYPRAKLNLEIAREAMQRNSI